MRTLIIAISAMLLTGCMITGSQGDIITVKPNAAQIQSAAKRVVCDSFKPFTFSGSKDTAETVRQAREHNAVLRAYGCIK
jgi:hypothetical protein